MNLETARRERAAQTPIVPGLPDAPGIRAAMLLTPSIGEHLRGLANALLVDEFPDSTLSRVERELLATRVSANNNCFFCADSHAAHATALTDGDEKTAQMIADVRECNEKSLTPKMRALADIAILVTDMPSNYEIEREAVQDALAEGASAGDVQLTVSIAAAFSMYNRFVDGFRAMTPPDPAAYIRRAEQITANGY